MTEYAVIYLRPDGWWEAGRGWTSKSQAARDAKEQLPKATWKVCPVAQLDEVLCAEARSEDRAHEQWRRT